MAQQMLAHTPEIRASESRKPRKRNGSASGTRSTISKMSQSPPSQNVDPAAASQITNIPHVGGPVPTVAHISDPHAYLMEVYDRLIAPSLTTTTANSDNILASAPNSNAAVASDAIRKCLYRKCFSDTATRELHLLITANAKEMYTIDELLEMTISLCAKVGLVIL